ncbi:MAG: methyltransferase family protein [Stackebrandtia sp.]
MTKSKAIAGSTVFFVAAPGTVAALVPWLLTGWEPAQSLPGWWWAPSIVAAAAILAGTVFVVQAFVRFVVEGLGTPVPAAPPERLVVGGPFRYVRNPMYVAIIVVLAGQALLLARWEIAAWLAGAWVVVATFVRIYEEPKLTELFGSQYLEYKQAVPAWIPRLRPWAPTGGVGGSADGRV